jgi:hypothetical protein
VRAQALVGVERGRCFERGREERERERNVSKKERERERPCFFARFLWPFLPLSPARSGDQGYRSRSASESEALDAQKEREGRRQRERKHRVDGRRSHCKTLRIQKAHPADVHELPRADVVGMDEEGLVVRVEELAELNIVLLESFLEEKMERERR